MKFLSRTRFDATLIILLRGTLRFSEICQRIEGVSEKILAQTLQTLERDGFVKRVAYPVVPPHVECSLTRSGREIGTLIRGLAVWVEDYISGHDADTTDDEELFREEL